MTSNKYVGVAIGVGLLALILLYIYVGLDGSMGRQADLNEARERFDGSTDAIQRGRKDLLP